LTPAEHRSRRVNAFACYCEKKLPDLHRLTASISAAKCITASIGRDAATRRARHDPPVRQPPAQRLRHCLAVAPAEIVEDDNFVPGLQEFVGNHAADVARAPVTKLSSICAH